MDADETVEIRDTAKAPARSFRARLRRVFRTTRQVLGALILLAEAAALAAGFALYSKYGEQLKKDDRKDPYASVAAGELGKTDVTYTRILADGTSITVNNRRAFFIGDVLKDDETADRLFPTFRDAIAFARAKKLALLPSVSLIHHRLKTEDDLLIEGIQLAGNREMRSIVRDFLSVLLARRNNTTGQDNCDYTEGAAFVATALSFSSELPPELPAEVKSQMAALLAEFESGTRSAPRMFDEAVVAERYARTPELARMFKQERFLMGRLEAGAAAAILHVLSENEGLRERFLRLGALNAVVDNPPEVNSLSVALERHGGKTLAEWRNSKPADPPYFVPTAISPENAYYYRRFGAGELPPGVNWMNEIVRAVRTGELDLTPTEKSGWYDRQLFALVPLLRSDHSFALSTRKLRVSESYRQFMEDTFRGALAANRETHVLRVQPVYICKLIGSGQPLELSPHFSCEPTPAIYYRLSKAYRFLHGGLDRVGYSHTDIGGRTLGDRLDELERITLSLSALSLLELGLPPDGLIRDPLLAGFPQSLQRVAEDWLARLPDDAVMATDKRFAIDVASGHKWANVGVRLRRLRYEYNDPPAVKGHDITLKPAVYYAPVAVFAEFTRPVPEGKFGAFCDRFATIDGCLSALGAQSSRSRGGDDRIPVETLFQALGVLVLLDAIFFLVGRTRRRVALAHSLAWWSVMAVVTLFAATPFGRAAVLLHLAPRFQVPRVPLAYATIWQLDQWCEAYDIREKRREGRREKVKQRRLGCADWLVSHALRSESKPVRESALQMYASGVEPGDRTIQALLQICETRDFEEVDFALVWFAGFPDFQCPGVYSFHPDSAARDLPRLLAILHRFGDAPSLVLKCAGAFSAAGDHSVLPLLENAIHECPATDPYKLAGLCHAVRLQPERLPYDVLTELEGWAPAKTKDGLTRNAAATSFPLPGMLALEALSRRYGELTYAVEYGERNPGWMREYQLLDRPARERALRDERLVDVVMRFLEGDVDYPTFCCVAYLDFPSHVGPVLRPVLLDRIATWLIEAPPDASPKRYGLVLPLILDRWSLDGGKKDEAQLAALRRLYESGRWNREPRFTGREETCGQALERILNPPPGPPEEDD